MADFELTNIERRVLAYLDQHGPTHRADVIGALAAPETRAGRGLHNGSNAAAPLIMGRWCARLVKAGFVIQRHSEPHRKKPSGFYRDHAITPAGKERLRRG